MDIKIKQLEKDSIELGKTAEFADNCSWEGAGKHMAEMLRQYRFNEWETAFAAFDNGKPVAFSTFLNEDFYPENRYSPWISSIFVDENYRGHRISGLLIEAEIAYALKKGFHKVYIPSDITGLYEKYGFTPIDKLTNYCGGIDTVFCREI